MRKDFLSACLVVYHEEDCIRRCLESIKGVVDEIIVVHDGPCRDKTMDIAKEYTDKIIITAKNIGSAEIIRNICFEQTSGDWILNIDADEELSPELRSQLRMLMADEKTDMYAFLWPYYLPNGEKLSQHTARYKQILFRRSKFYHASLPHMVGRTRGVSKGIDVELRHYLKDNKTFWQNVLSDAKKNRQRARAGADMILHPEKIKTYQCSIRENNLPFSKKIARQKRFPLACLLFSPLYGFGYWFFKHKYYREGLIGLQNAVYLPVYAFFLCWYVAKLKYGILKPEHPDSA